MWAQIIQAILQTALKAAPGIATATSKAGRFEKKQMREAIDRVKQGRLGMSQAAQNQIASAATADQQAQNKAMTAELQRSIAAGGGSAAPVALDVMKAQQQGAAQAGAAARSMAAAQSAQVAEQQRQQALGMADKRKKEIKENWQAVAGSTSPSVPAAQGDTQSLASTYGTKSGFSK